jgi:hypothetical protein
MTTTKLIQEDIAWLESRLSNAIDPVSPRPEFINRAREELMSLPPQPMLPAWVKRTTLAAVLLSLLALIIAMFFFYQRGREE